MRKSSTELEIRYFPQTDTLYIGSAQIANDGYDNAGSSIAHANEDGEVVGITLEHAAEVLAPYLRERIAGAEPKATVAKLPDNCDQF